MRAAIASGPFGRKNTPITKFPNPPQESFGFKSAKRFFEYWCAIPENVRDLVEVRVYRTWPQVKMELAEPTRQDHCWETIYGACPFDPENFETQLMMRDGYGSGDYRLDLKESGNQGILTKAYVRSQDLQSFPPVIDYSTLVNCPANQEYIRGLMKRNIKLPWEYEPEGENEMAGTGVGDAVKMMSEAVVTTAKMAVENAHAAADARVEAAQSREDAHDAEEEDDSAVEQSAMSAAFQMVATAAEKTIDMVTRNAGGQFNPIDMMKAAKDLMGDNGGTQLLVTTIREQGERMLTMQQENLKFMRDTMEQRTGPAAAAVDPFAMMLEKSSQIKQMADLFGWGPSERDRDEPPAAPVAPRAPEKTLGQQIGENIVPIVTGLSAILTMGANIFYNMKLAPGTAPRNPAEDMAAAQAQNPLNAMAGHPGMPPGSPPVAAMPTDPLDEFRPFVINTANQLLAHFFGTDQDYNGYTFAEFVLSAGTGAGPNPEGRRVYGMLKERLGREKFDQLVKEHFPVWSKIQGMPGQWVKFLDEFFGYDEWARQQETAV